MRMYARVTAAAGQAAVAQLAWHLLGPAWAFGLAVFFIAMASMAIMPPAVAGLEKAASVEKRLNSVISQIPSKQATPGSVSNSSYGVTNSSYGVTNSSYGMSGGTNVTYNSGSGNNGGGPGSQTSGQIGGASAHYHDMTHFHTSSSSLENTFNALRDSHSNLVPAYNALRDSHSNLVPAYNTLRDSHSNLLPGHNTLISRLESSGILLR